jgi:hypothetical protein
LDQYYIIFNSKEFQNLKLLQTRFKFKLQMETENQKKKKNQNRKKAYWLTWPRPAILAQKASPLGPWPTYRFGKVPIGGTQQSEEEVIIFFLSSP